MLEIICEAFSPVNVILTGLLILMVLYWLGVIVGALDIDLLHVDAEVGADVDAGVEAGAEADGGGALRSFLAFFNVGELPVMVLVSLMILSMWIISMAANHYLNSSRSLLLAAPLLAGNVAVSLLIVKAVSTPFKKLFRAFDRDYNAPRSVIGRICTITTTTVSDRLGQAEIRTGGAPILLNVVTENGQVLGKGDEAVVVSRDEARNVYVVAAVELDGKHTPA